MDKEHKKIIGRNIQELIAVELERYFPEPDYTISTNHSWGKDIVISDGNGTRIEGEVKSAIELFTHSWKRKTDSVIHSHIRRGMFNLFEHELDVDFFVFVVRFVNEGLEWNNDIEVWFSKGKDVKSFVEKRLYKCGSYNLAIEKLRNVKATQNFEDLDFPKHETETEIDVEALFQ